MLTFLYLIFSLAFLLVLAFVVYHVIRFALRRINSWRAEHGKKPWSDRQCFFLALFATLGFIL